MKLFYQTKLVFLLLFIGGVFAIDYDEYDYPENSDQFENNSTVIIDDYENDESEECSVDRFIDNFVKLVLPDDYEEANNVDIYRKSKHINETIAKLKRLHIYAQNVSKKFEPILKRIMPRMSEILLLIDLPPDCMASLARIGSAAKDGNIWAMKFLDSQPSINSGQLLINGPPLAQYDECLSIVSPHEEDKPTIKGQYCPIGLPNMIPSKESFNAEEPVDDYFIKLINEQMNKSKGEFEIKSQHKHYFMSDGRFVMRPEWLEELMFAFDSHRSTKMKNPTGLCLPTTCDPKDIEYALNKLIYPITLIPFIINPDCDYTDKPVVLNKYQTIAVITFSILAILVILSTTFEIILNLNGKHDETSYALLIGKSFSVIKNVKPIFNVELTNEKWTALDGIKAIFAFWIFLTHEYIGGLMYSHVKKLMDSATFHFYEEFKYLLLKNINILETFFLIGGMMTCYVMFSKLDKSKGRFSYFQYAIYRYVRTIPALIGVMFIIYLTPLFGDGPLWDHTLSIVLTAQCYNNWNSSILMINNYDVGLPNRFGCNPPTWYTACDYQLYLMAPIVFLVLYYSPRIGMIFNISLVALGSFIMISPKLLFGIKSIWEMKNVMSSQEAVDSFVHNYYGLEPHFGPYMLGILLGYIIRKKPDIYFGGRIGELFLWIISWSMTTWSFFWGRNYYALSYDITQTEVWLWLAFSKYCYCAGWFWTLYACTTGRGGFVNDILGWKGFKYISNLANEIYLLHFTVVIYRIAVIRDQVFYSDYYVWTASVYDFLMVYILAVMLSLLVSRPFANLVDIFMKPPIKKSDSIGKIDLKSINNNNVTLINTESNISKTDDKNFVDISNENNVINIKISECRL